MAGMSLTHRIRHWLRRGAPVRPLWQRIVYPLSGLVLVAVGMIGWLLPVIPGFPLVPLGIPLLFAFSQRWEDSSKRAMRRCWLVCRRGWHAVRRRWRRRAARTTVPPAPTHG